MAFYGWSEGYQKVMESASQFNKGSRSKSGLQGSVR